MNTLLLTSTTGVAGFASAIGEGYTADSMWGQLIPFASIITLSIAIAFGIKAFRGLGRRMSKGKGGI